MTENLPMSEIHFDENGLIPAVVQEACSGKVLMLAYMNEESLRKTLETGETWYYSRSRRELWHKGETSGHFQKVRSISVDCDADTLLIQVDQIGAACHTGNKSCFFRALSDCEGEYAGSLAVLSDLKDEIKEKHAHPTEKSYTAYLLGTGIDKICKKIGEESSEVMIGAKNLKFAENNLRSVNDLPAAPTAQPRNGFVEPAPARRDFCGESADLLYHLSVLWECVGVTVNDVTAVLEERTHVKGNKKTVGHQDKTF